MEGREGKEYRLTSKGRDRKGRETGRERKGGEGEERGKQPALTKNRSCALASKHQFGRPVKMLQTSWPLMEFAIRQTQSSHKFQSQEQSYQCQQHSPTSKAFSSKTKVTLNDLLLGIHMPRSKA